MGTEEMKALSTVPKKALDYRSKLSRQSMFGKGATAGGVVLGQGVKSVQQ